MHIVQLANFWTPTSGGLRTVLHHLGAEYVERGHRVTRVVPGATPGVGRPTTDDTGVTTITLGAPVLPASGGYRVVRDRKALAALLRDLRPDAIELSDKTTMVAPAAAMRARGSRVVLVSHERIDAILQPRPIVGWLRRERLALLADRHNRSLVARVDAVVAASDFAAAEFTRIGAPVVHRVPFGVDLHTFRPTVGAPARHGTTLVYIGRLSREKEPATAIDVARELRRRGLPFELVMIGDGPDRTALERRAAGLPVRFVGHIADRAALAVVLRHAALAICPCPHETFGLAALEAMASGTPVVVPAVGALSELVAQRTGDERPGLAVEGGALAMADAVVELTGPSHPGHRLAARRRAECFSWSAAASTMESVLSGAQRRAIAV